MKEKYEKNATHTYLYPCMVWGLQHHLHFSPSSRLRKRLYYSTSEWIEMINKNLEERHPVLYRGRNTRNDGHNVGHFFVIDGINSEGKYHINFGHASSTQDKFADLNVINQGKDTFLGSFSVCYHHQQAMITDLYPEENLNNEAFDEHAIMLNSPIVLNDDPQTSIITVSDKVKATFNFCEVAFSGKNYQVALGFYKNNTLVGETSYVQFNREGKSTLTDLKINNVFILPSNLADDSYEMSIMSRLNDTSKWTRGWDCAPNSILVNVKNHSFSFNMPNYHTLNPLLYLENNIKEVDNSSNNNGHTLELTVENTSDNNYESIIRIEITSEGKTHNYDMPTSIYGFQTVTLRFFIPNSDIPNNNEYTVNAFYYDANINNYVKLTDIMTTINNTEHHSYDDFLRIYNSSGLIIAQLPYKELESNYMQLLRNLPKGIYIVKDKESTRKIVKSN